MKNGEDRLVVLNRVARSVIESVRGMHSDSVFVSCRSNEGSAGGTAAKYATATDRDEQHGMEERSRACGGQLEEAHWTTAPLGFRKVRVHDLKHTFGRRLRAAGVSFEDRQDLLGHKSSRITTHYSAAELSNLIAAAEMACDESRNSPTTTWLRRRVGEETRDKTLSR